MYKPVYDVLAIVSAMEVLKIDAAAVIDAFGGVSAASLDDLHAAAGVSFVDCMAVKRALDSGSSALSVTAVPAQVCAGHYRRYNGCRCRVVLVSARGCFWCDPGPFGFRCGPVASGSCQ